MKKEEQSKLKLEIEKIIKDGFCHYLGERKDASFDDQPIIEYVLPRLMNLILLNLEEEKENIKQKEKERCAQIARSFILKDNVPVLKSTQQDVDIIGEEIAKEIEKNK